MTAKPSYEELEKEISRLKQAEEVLLESEKKLNIIADSSLDSIFIKDMERRYSFVNRSLTQLFECQESDLLGKRAEDIFSPEDADSIKEVDSRSYKGEIVSDVRDLCINGNLHSFHAIQSPIRDPHGNITGITGIVRDITERKQMQEEYKDASERFRKLAESSFDGVVIIKNGVLVEANSTFAALYGYEPSEVIGMKVLDFIAPESKDLVSKNIMSGYEAPYEATVLKKDGTKFEVEASGTRLNYKGHSARITAMRDITKRKRAEEALRESEERYRLLVESHNAPISIVDKEGLFLSINYIGAANFGLKPSDIIGKSVRNLFPSKADTILERHQKIIESGIGESIEEVYDLPVGKKFYLVNILPAKDGNGNIFGVMAFSYDITERKRVEEDKVTLEEQLRQAQKMEAIGTLAGGIAHDFNNTIAAILINAEMSILQNEENNILRSNLEEIIQSVNHGKDLVEQIFSFARPSTQERRPLDIRLVISEIHEFLKATLSSTIKIRQNIQVKSGTILADSTQIKQIFMNLCTNAAHAMRDKNGLLEINLADEILDQKDIVTYPELKPGAYLQITIKDTGHGIDKTDIDRVFDPFFTTKGPGEGTGLGLSVVHGIVKNHEGAIRVKSKPDKGSTFQILLPKEECEASEKVKKLHPVSKAEKGICILFVDDEKVFVTAGKKMLEHIGYKVIAHTSSIEALKDFREQPEKIDLVISDMVMPDMSGVDLSKKLLQIRPDLPIIICTGYNELINSKKAKGIGIREMLKKPFYANELANTIEKVLLNNVLNHD